MTEHELKALLEDEDGPKEPMDVWGYAIWTVIAGLYAGAFCALRVIAPDVWVWVEKIWR